MTPIDGRTALRAGDVVEVAVEKGVYRGLGLARHEGQVVFVPRGVPGDRLRVRVESVTRGFARVTLGEVLEASPQRRTSPCPYAPRCGGCAYQEMEYSAQVRLKGAILGESLARAGVRWTGDIPVRSAPEQGWRTRALFHLELVAGELRLGLHEEGGHRVLDLEHCLQLSPAMNRAARGLLAALRDRPSLASRVRHVDLAESPDGSALVAAIESDMASKEATAAASLAEGAPGLTGLGVVVVDGGRRRYLSLRGDPYVHARILGLVLRAHVRSFFQVNRYLVEELAREVVEAVPGGGRVIDLYAGVGLFALPLGTRSEQVLAAELNPIAMEDAEANALTAGLQNVGFHRGDVREALASWPVEAGEHVILDPPRTGAGADVVRAVAARRPASVTYVSCDPPTLGRDLRTFLDEGYRPQLVRAFDLFPNTFHVEAVVRLAK